MRLHFAPSLALLFGFGCWAVLFAAPTEQAPTLLDQPSKLGYDPQTGIIHVMCKSEQIRYFDTFLREIESLKTPQSWPILSVSASGTGVLQLPVWSGRQLQVEIEAGTMALGSCTWEEAPRLSWGPGWALVTWRTADPEITLEWRQVGGTEIHRRVPQCDRWDGMRRRAWLENLKAGERIELRYRPSGMFFPPRSWTDWQEFEVPEIDPAGDRPTVELPRG